MEKSFEQKSRYMKNPDVVVREEDEDGALIFNPDTDQIRVINPTGFFIWNLCDGGNDLTGIILAVKESFKDVPDDKVFRDVEEYIGDMVEAGFIGIVKENEKPDA